jgi:glycosyltransferase involved in cell wall biosynthesis
MLNEPFLCIITPIFDGAVESVKLLVEDLKNQTFTDFIHVLISNGESSQIREYLKTQDDRFKYIERPYEPALFKDELFGNIRKRRNYGLQNFDAKRYAFLDADLKIIDNEYFQKLFDAHDLSEVLLTKIRLHNSNPMTTLPRFPINAGRIDMANFSFSKRLAKSYTFPTSLGPEKTPFQYKYAGDYLIFHKICPNNNYQMLNFVSAIRNGNTTYKRLSEL